MDEVGMIYSADLPTRPAELVLAAAVARRFFCDDRSKIEIAEEFSISRYKVARLIDAARANGIVRIQIVLPATLDGDLSEQVRIRFGLRRAIVVSTADEAPEASRNDVGRVAGGLLAEVTTGDDVVGVAWGRTLRALADVAGLAPATLVQLAGVLAHPDVEQNALELVRRIARRTGGRSITYYAPLIVPDAATARGLRAQPGIRDAMSTLDGLTTAVISIGAWRANESTLYDALSVKERQRLADRGVRAESTGLLFDEHGILEGTFAQRVVGVTADQLHRTPEVIGVAHGHRRAGAVASILAAGILTSLVIDASLARELLQTAEQHGR